MTYRDQAARDRAWARYYARHGLQPIKRNFDPIPNVVRLAEYAIKRLRLTHEQHRHIDTTQRIAQ